MTDGLLHPIETWKWLGNPAHFICGRWCRFHLATLIGPWLVSTVGAFVHPRNSGGSEKTEDEWLAANAPGENIGYQRKFETMVFRAGKRCEAKGCDCGLPTLGGDGIELGCIGANTAGDATKAHMQLCLEWANKKDETP